MKVVRVKEFSQFDKVLSEVLNSEHCHLFVYFFGTELPETNQSWCPDCVVADPRIRSNALKVKDCVLLEVPVGDRASYKNQPQNPYRLHEQIKLKSVPTLIRWTKEGPQAKIEQDEDFEEANLETFFKV